MEQVEIRVNSQLDSNWSKWFNGLSVTHTKGGETVLVGPVRDQSELRGILFRLADLGLSLMSVNVKKRAPENLVSAADGIKYLEHPHNFPEWR